MSRAHAILAAYVAVVAALLFAVPAHSTSTPPLISVPSVTVMENAGSAPVVILKAKASSYSKVNVQTVDGTAKAGIDYKPVNVTITLANSATSYRLPIAIIDNATFQGSRSFTVKLTAVRFASVPAVPATVTINDDEVTPPAPVPSGWVAAPLTNGGYARCKTVGGCHSIAYPCPPLLNTTGPVYCSYPNIIAQQGDVRLQAWNGIDQNNRIVVALWPVGHDPRVTKLADDWRLGVEAWQDEWEGVAPAP